MKKYDLQVHTDASPCSKADPKEVVQTATQLDLDGIAITNHDTLKGYKKAKDFAPKDLTIIPGSEVTTDQGHILALDINRVPPKADPLKVIENIHDQEGIAVLSHPFDRLRDSYTKNLEKIADVVDAVETINSRCILPWSNKKAENFAEKYKLPTTGSSDAHFPKEIGRAYTISEIPIIEAIRKGKTKSQGKGGYISGHLSTIYHQLSSNFKNRFKKVNIFNYRN